MRLIRTLGLSIGLACMAVVAHAAAPWEVVKQGEGREGISTWARPAEGMAVKEFKGVTEVHYSILSVMALVGDTSNLNNWVFNCKLAEHPAGLPADQKYMQFKGIWPASDRDALVKTVASQKEDRSVVVATGHVGGYPVREDFVRMPYLANEFRLTPLKDGWTRVEFETRVDLGGLVPAWLAGIVSTKAPLVTLEGLQRELKKPKYQAVKSPKELPTEFWRGAPMVVPDFH
ncbi:MAG: hypothetical protein V4532_03780 [Pseudomonadota bacterium]